MAGFDDLLNVAAEDREKLDAMASADEERADRYAALFNSPLGRMVLDDMYRQYVNVTQWHPGQSPEHGFYRSGMAQVVWDIAYQIAKSERNKEDGTA